VSQTDPRTDEDLLAAARELLAGINPSDAKPLLHQITAAARSSAWSEAHVELSLHHFCLGETELSIAHANEVLQGPPELVTDRARAIAGVMSCNARDMADQELDDELLQRSAEACLNIGEHQYAAIGFEILGYRKTSTDRPGARRLLDRAAHLFDSAGSTRAAARVLVRLAWLSLEEDGLDEARAYRDRTVTQLAKLLPGYAGPALERELRELQDAIAKAVSTR
jgi:hypothetical protein